MASLSDAFQIAYTHEMAGRLDLAAEVYRRIVAADPTYTDAWVNLGNVLQRLDRVPEALPCYEQALRVRPDLVEAHNNLGSGLRALGRDEEAIACFHRALSLRTDYPEALNNLANALHAQGKTREALACYERAVQVKPDFAYAHNNLGDYWREQRKLDQAVACYQRALQFAPQTASIWNNCGVALREQGKSLEAIAYFRRAMELDPGYSGAIGNLGGSFKDQGQLDEALACFRRAAELNPTAPLPHSNLLYTLYYSPKTDAQLLRDEHRRWTSRHAQHLARTYPPPANDRTPQRRLRVGYVSADFYGHPVALFLLPVLEARDRAQFEVYCYSSARAPDEITAGCRANSEAWRDVWHLNDAQLADLVRQDQIDILVDLSLHTEGNRLLVFARKPAPVQVSYLGFCGTTGLDTVDYRLTDPYLDPPGTDAPYYSEESVRLPETYWCYRPATPTGEPGPLPALTAGHVTFGCLNNFCKVTPPTLDAWGRLLAAVPDSRLLLHCRVGPQRERVVAALGAHGVRPERITLVDLLPTPQYFQTFQYIDVALDPFPYGGGTTTCDALWMGVPVVSLAGKLAVGRGGLSILSNVGLADLVGRDVDQYVQIAAGLAADVPRLQELRATMRERMRRSPLMDAPRFARNLEAAYRQMWRRWCGA
jgi:predicted O-linked N-acetylglucosamine transferase (SPINDLY family)